MEDSQDICPPPSRAVADEISWSPLIAGLSEVFSEPLRSSERLQQDDGCSRVQEPGDAEDRKIGKPVQNVADDQSHDQIPDVACRLSDTKRRSHDATG